MKSTILISLFFFLVSGSIAQTAQEGELIQLSGIVLTADSLIGIPYSTVMIKRMRRGTACDGQGFFSLVVGKGDTVVFSAVGYKPNFFVVPDSLDKSKYSVIELLTTDTLHIAETVINPWPTREQFKEAFLALNIPDDDWERAMKNLERQRLRELGESMVMDANENADYYLRTEAQKFYYAGQAPPMNIFNPLAWAEFIQAWKDGDFKKDKNK